MNKHCEHCIWVECEEHGEVCPFYDVDENEQKKWLENEERN